ncbi:hypothetical protein COV12_03680 [Candidatus Woesearchaeota archaeon CG10_big_fil_rev_8_21_14_0_10_32_24]|nr:MAG: hypothetical protein COV12_03680 [Candidatus Woesearchaeota archaeon CG10_big_fil_rev_8_21_14_0_10_32_24]
MKEQKNKKKDSTEDTQNPVKEQGILPEETSEEISEDMEHGDKDEDIYSDEGRDKLEDDDEIEPWEEGFMEGASQAGQLGKDALTGESLMDVEDVVETEINGKMYRFVSEENAVKFKKKKEAE